MAAPAVTPKVNAAVPPGPMVTVVEAALGPVSVTTVPGGPERLPESRSPPAVAVTVTGPVAPAGTLTFSGKPAVPAVTAPEVPGVTAMPPPPAVGALAGDATPVVTAPAPLGAPMLVAAAVADPVAPAVPVAVRVVAVPKTTTAPPPAGAVAAVAEAAGEDAVAAAPLVAAAVA